VNQLTKSDTRVVQAPPLRKKAKESRRCRRCCEPTRKLKPYCTEHNDQNPEGGRAFREEARRKQHLRVLRHAPSRADVQSTLADDVLGFLRYTENQTASLPYIAKQTQLPFYAVKALARAMQRTGWIRLFNEHGRKLAQLANDPLELT
jgi:hypothetical protein